MPAAAVELAQRFFGGHSALLHKTTRTPASGTHTCAAFSSRASSSCVARPRCLSLRMLEPRGPPSPLWHPVKIDARKTSCVHKFLPRAQLQAGCSPLHSKLITAQASDGSYLPAWPEATAACSMACKRLLFTLPPESVEAVCPSRDGAARGRLGHCLLACITVAMGESTSSGRPSSRRVSGTLSSTSSLGLPFDYTIPNTSSYVNSGLLRLSAFWQRRQCLSK